MVALFGSWMIGASLLLCQELQFDSLNQNANDHKVQLIGHGKRMGLRSWLAGVLGRIAAYSFDRQVEANVMAAQVPELAGMTEAEAMTYVLDQIHLWNAKCTPGQSAELAGRIAASKAVFERQGSHMPFWWSLWVLRTHQRRFGHAA